LVTTTRSVLITALASPDLVTAASSELSATSAYRTASYSSLSEINEITAPEIAIVYREVTTEPAEVVKRMEARPEEEWIKACEA
jgi:hypothetical protein